MVERAEQQHRVCSHRYTREIPSVSEYGGQTVQVPTSGCFFDLLHMSFDRLDDVDLEATFGERHCLDAGAASDVQDSTWTRRQVSIEKLQCSDVFEARSSVDNQT